jgi:predicted ArsR family transcriptional regulator
MCKVGGVTDDLQLQARALGDPTRHEVFRYLGDAGGPVGVAELTEHFGLHHNAIRQHLAKLVDAGLVIERAAAPSGRGRPRREYEVSPSADSRWGVTGPYERLSVLLTEVVRSGDTPLEVGRRAASRAHVPPTDGDPIDVLVDQMARHGFEPRVRDRGGEVIVTLQECPFASAALTDADTICQLHLGLAEGIATSIGGFTVDELVAKDPRRARCLLRCHRTDAAPSTT